MNDRGEFGERRRSLFSQNVNTYSTGRPGYPGSVFEILSSECGLGPDCRVLEIGPGTGQATGPMLDAGAHVTAVEIGAEMARHLEGTHADRHLDVVTGDFMAEEFDSRSFDLAVAATSFHWIPPDEGLARIATMLRPRGSVALLWNCYGDPDRPDPYADALRPILQRRAPHLVDNGSAAVAPHPYALDVASRCDEIARCGLFDAVEHRILAWTATLTAPGLREFFGSFSLWMDLDDSTRNPLLDDVERLAVEQFGGIVQRPCLTALYTAKRR